MSTCNKILFFITVYLVAICISIRVNLLITLISGGVILFGSILLLTNKSTND